MSDCKLENRAIANMKTNTDRLSISDSHGASHMFVAGNIRLAI